MRILMVTSEAEPFAKTGGLADVLGALPRALARLGHLVDVVMPRYRGIEAGEQVGGVVVSFGARLLPADVYATSVGDRHRVVFIDGPLYFHRDHLYGVGSADYPDNAERFAFLAHAALGWAARTGDRYDIVHAHDWQAGLVPLLLTRTLRYPALSGAGTVFTIHNLAYQGLFEPEWLPRLGLGWEHLDVDIMEFWGRISYLKAGITSSRLITTVSPRYAREVQTPEFGFGFDGILRHRSDSLVGILNGIDYDQWDPSRDPNLPEPFSASNPAGKRAAKQTVLEDYGLPVTSEVLARPLVGMISRLVDQKGFDLMAALADELPRLDASFLLLGTGERRYEELWRDLAARHPDRIGARIGFDERLAHRIEGGADMFLMPSRFEPCGLNQMYSLRYGTVPVVRATGGLYDSVRDVNPATGEGTGFSFEQYAPSALLAALRRALDAYRNPELWRRVQLAGMQQDFSWDASAREYVRVYERAAGRER